VRQVLGVTRPVLELVPPDALREENGAISFILRDDRAGVEGAGELGRARVAAFRGSRVVVEVEADSDAVLIYRDNMAPGWTARIDGQEAELLVVDRVNKAVAVPAGRHEVTFVYRPWFYLAAFFLRALALAGAVLACGWATVTARRQGRVAAVSKTPKGDYRY
jgi:hypothetical protein